MQQTKKIIWILVNLLGGAAVIASYAYDLAGSGPNPGIIQRQSPGKNIRHKLYMRMWTSCLL